MKVVIKTSQVKFTTQVLHQIKSHFSDLILSTMLHPWTTFLLKSRLINWIILMLSCSLWIKIEFRSCNNSFLDLRILFKPFKIALIVVKVGKLTYCLILKIPAMLKMILIMVKKATIKTTTRRTTQTLTQRFSNSLPLSCLVMAVYQAGHGINLTVLLLKLLPVTTLILTPFSWRELRGAETRMASSIMRVAI